MTMLFVEPTNRRHYQFGINAKRCLDLSLTALIVFAIWPFLIMISMAVGVTSRGPVFFVQTRVGLDGKLFNMIKFRSMYRDAEARRDKLAALSDREGLCLKIINDPRITPVGRFLRRWSLDELPQIFNVLIGDMSLVGPRPALLQEVAEYPDRAHQRYMVLPGITGLWQVSGRADVSFEDMIDLDLDYVQSTSVQTDIRIMLRTFQAVLSGKGAY